MIELTRNQKIGFGFGAAGVLLVILIVVIYFVFIKKDTPEPDIKSSGSTKADTDAAAKAKADAAAKAKAEAAAKADAAAAAKADTAAAAKAKAEAAAKVKAEAAAKVKDLEPILIEGRSIANTELLEYSAKNDNSLREKDTLITTNEGCWTFLDVEPNSFKLGFISDMSELITNPYKIVYITKVKLPSDVRAEAWGAPYNANRGVCRDKHTLKTSIEPGATMTFDVPSPSLGSNYGNNYVYGLKFMKA